jgi:SAM-dependent methyltransferase
MMEDVVVTPYKFYLNEDRKTKPKEYFKFIRDNLSKMHGDVMDVGCATGDFLWFLADTYDGLNLNGIDIDNELAAKARLEVPQANIRVANFTSEGLGGQKYDWVFMNGVHSIFDPSDPSLFLKPLVAGLKNEMSTLCIFGIFNPEDLDVRISSRASSTEGQWETGWNLISKKTIMDWCDLNKLHGEFIDFELDIDIEKNENEPLRSWTIRNDKDKKIVVNGLQLLHTFSLLKINLL